jgi:hypothetical protein
MSRTFRRNNDWNSGALRYPQTFREIKQLDGVLHEEDLNDFTLSGRNHLKARENNLPDAWDDLRTSSYYEKDFKF